MGRITLYGFYQYDNTILTEITVPDGCDKNFLIDEIIHRSGDLYTYYQQPDLLKSHIKNWFSRNLTQFQKLFDTLTVEYDPIANYNRYENLLETPNISTTEKLNRDENGTGGSESTVGSTAENKKSAFDSSSYSPYTQTKTDSTSENSSDYSTNETETSNRTETGTRKHENHIYGNIGVTSTQELITAERELTKFDFYREIAQRFETEFLVQIY